jgi:hypothetical protein
MGEALRARASVVQSLLRALERRTGARVERLLAQLRANGEVQKILRAPAIAWVDEGPFLRVLSTAHAELGDTTYLEVIHEASMIMLQTGVVRAARMASTMFLKPGLGGYVKWTPRIWSLSFQGLTLTLGERDDEGSRLVLSGPPAAGFTRPVVLGAAGTVQTVFTLAKVAGRVRVEPYQVGDARVVLRIQAARAGVP